MRYVCHTAFVIYGKKTFRPKNEAYFWHREGASFNAWKAGIFILTYFKSRLRVETWTPVVRLILITCELLSRVTQCCVVMFMLLKKWLMSTGTKILLWQCWECGDSFLTCFAPWSLLFQYFISAMHFLCTSSCKEPSWNLGLSSIAEGLTSPRQVNNLHNAHHLCKCLLRNTQTGSVAFPLLSSYFS